MKYIEQEVVIVVAPIWLWFDISHTHRKLYCYQKLIKGLIRLKFGMWSPSNLVSLLTTCLGDNGCDLIIATPT